MTAFVFANNINTQLAGAISSSSTTLTLSSTINLPTSIPSGSVMALTLNDAATKTNYEIVYVTAINGATLTVLRAQEGTSAQAWLTGDLAFSGPTAGQMENFSQIAASGVPAGNYGSSTQVGSFTVNSQGILTAASNTAIAFPVTSFNGRAGAISLNSGDVTTALGFTPLGASIAASTLLGNPTSSAAAPTTVTLANGLQFSGTSLGLGAITPSSISTTGHVAIATADNPAGLVISDSSTYAGIKLTAGNGTTAPSKIIRADGIDGCLEVINSANSAIILSLSDAGALSVPGTLAVSGTSTLTGTLTVTGSIINDSSGSILYTNNIGTTSGTLAVVGNVSTSGTSESAYGIYTSGNVGYTGSEQGAYIGWNYSGGTGEMDFVNNEGNGSGGFNWYNATLAGASVTLIMAMTGAGNLTTYGTTVNFNASDADVKTNFVAREARPSHHLWFGDYDRIDTGAHGIGHKAQDIRLTHPHRVFEDAQKTVVDAITGRERPMLVIDRVGLCEEQGIWNGHQIDALLTRVSALEAKAL